MKKNMGIITILVGVGLLFISILFSSGSHPNRNFLGNISQMETVLAEGTYYSGSSAIYSERTQRLLLPSSPGGYAGRVAIPFKYSVSLSVLLILIGTGILLIAKNKNTNA